MNDVIEAFVVYVPKIVRAFALLVLGFVLAVVASRVTPFLLRRIRFDQVCDREGVTNLMREEESTVPQHSWRARLFSTPCSRSRWLRPWDP